MVKLCSVCAKLSPINDQSWPPTDKIWFNLHVDYTRYWNGADRWIFVDNFSKWTEIFKCRRHTSPVTAKDFEQFSRFEVPDDLVIYNSMQFISSFFQHFCKYCVFEHIKSRNIDQDQMVRLNVLFIRSKDR